MKLQAESGEAIHDLDIKRDGDRVTATIDDREYELEVSEPEPNVFLLKHAGNVHEFHVAPAASAGDAQMVYSRRGDLEVRIIDPKRLRGAGTGSDHGDGAAEIRTAMPGKVVRVLKQVGDAVEKGEGILVVEAMKMQNELKSPKAGSVKELRIDEGATVAAGQVLAVIE